MVKVETWNLLQIFGPQKLSVISYGLIRIDANFLGSLIMP